MFSKTTCHEKSFFSLVFLFFCPFVSVFINVIFNNPSLNFISSSEKILIMLLSVLLTTIIMASIGEINCSIKTIFWSWIQSTVALVVTAMVGFSEIWLFSIFFT